MKPSSSDNSNPPDSGSDATAAESRADSPEHSDNADRDQRSAITGAYADPALIVLLEGFRTSDGNQDPAGAVVLADPNRLRAVDATGLLEPGPHPEVDQVVAMTIAAAGVPFAALNLITDLRQTTAGAASRAGAIPEPQPRALNDSLCVYTVMSGNPLIIDDMSEHPVLVNHPTARAGEVAAYIGIPIVDDAGQAVGTLCAWDTDPHHWSSGEVQIMTDLADVVRNLIFKR